MMIDRCIEDVVYDSTGTYTWGEIEQGDASQLPCPRNPDSLALRTCDIDEFGQTSWSLPDTTACVMVSFFFKYILSYYNKLLLFVY